MQKLINEKELERLLERIELKRSYPELVIKLINEIQDKSFMIYEEIRSLYRMIFRQIDQIRGRIILCEPPEQEICVPIVGVDGSLVLMRGIGRRFLALISVSQVIFPQGLQDIENPRVNLSVSMETVEERYDKPPKSQAILRMMLGESKAINILANELANGYIMIDGPIIDPPNMLEVTYIEYRAEALSNAIKKGIEVIGVVKRYRSNILRDKFFKELPPVSDQEIAPILFSIIRKEKTIKPNQALAVRPIPLSSENEGYSKQIIEAYKDALKNCGIEDEIYTSYLQVHQGIRPIKVEFFAKNEKVALHKIQKIIKLFKDTTVVGTNLPLPILLAHKTCLIRKRVAEVLVKEVLSRVASFRSQEIDFQVLRDLIYISEGD